MKKNYIGLIGYLGNGNNVFEGQSIKTTMIYSELKKKYGEKKIYIINTYNWKKNILKNIFKCIIMKIKCSNIIILPAQNSVKILIPFFIRKNLFNKYKLHYIMIGGWLPSLLNNNRKLKKACAKVDFIYTETNYTKKQLNEVGLKNVVIMKNFKNLKVTKFKYAKNSSNQFKLCIFSRIEELKGIDDAIYVVNKYYNKISNNIKLDIYGNVKDEYKEKFFSQLNEVINYCGIIDYDKSVETIQKYDLLLFPTLYKTEGIPGTILDSYYAGVPVLASKWLSFSDVITDNITGFGYDFGNKEDFYNKLCFIIENKDKLKKMSNSCKKEALNYNIENCLEVLFKNIK